MSHRAAGKSLLTWKLEDSPGASSDDDVGPAWVDGDDGSTWHPILGGRWVTRGEARAIATEHGLVFFEDDGTLPVRDSAVSADLDVGETNRKLRAAGFSEAELRIEESGVGDVLLWGTLLQTLPELARDPESPFTTAMVSMSSTEALNALDLLVPQWRSAG